MISLLKLLKCLALYILCAFRPLISMPFRFFAHPVAGQGAEEIEYRPLTSIEVTRNSELRPIPAGERSYDCWKQEFARDGYTEGTCRCGAHDRRQRLATVGQKLESIARSCILLAPVSQLRGPEFAAFAPGVVESPSLSDHSCRPFSVARNWGN